MRIAMLSWESMYSIAVGGVSAHVSELAAALVEDGHDVHVFTRRAWNQGPHDHIAGVHYHRCFYGLNQDFIEDVNNMCRALVDAVLTIEGVLQPFDVIHAHDWLAANAMMWIKDGRPARRCVLTVHSTEYGRCGNTFTHGRAARIREIERAGVHRADQVIAVSKATQDELTWMYELPVQKVTVIHNGVHPHRFDGLTDRGAHRAGWGLTRQDKIVLFCGRLTWQKGPDLLLEAIPVVRERHPHAHYIFAGDGDMRGGLEARAHQLGLNGRARFLGHLTGDALTSIYHEADIVAVPSRNEPFGIVVLESWSAGKPVVVTQIGGPAEYVEHEVTGLKIYPNPDSIAWGVNSMLHDDHRAARMARNGQRLVHERFTWDRIALLTAAAYRRLLRTKPRRAARVRRSEPVAQVEHVVH